MRDAEKTKEQLLSELADLRNHAAELQAKLKELQRSEHEYRELFDRSMDGLAVVDAETLKIVLCNQQAANLYGFNSVDEAIGVNPLDFIHPDDKERTLKHIADYLFEKDRREPNVFRTVTKDGKEKWINAVGIVIDYHGKKAALASFRDITQSKRMEEALRESEERYRSVIDNANESIIVAQDGMLKFFNPRVLEKIGYTAEELTTKPFLELIHPDDRQMVLEQHLRRLRGEEFPHVYPFRIVCKNGTIRWVEVNAVLISWNGKPATLNFLSDITERKLTGEALRQSEEKLRLTFESIDDSIIVIDTEGRVLDVNEAAIRIAGFKNKQHALGTNAFDIISPKDRERVMKAFRERQAGRPQRNTECAIQSKRGKNDIVAEITASPLRDTSDKLIGYIAVLRDITERKLMEQALRESGEKLSLIFESITDGIILIDMEGNIVDVNEATVRMSGYGHKGEIIGRSSLEFIAEKDRAHAVEDMSRQIREGRGSALSYYTLMDKNGNEYYGEISATILPDISGKPAGFIAVVRDITERKLMEKALRESGEKLSLIFESIEDGIILIDLDGNVVDANEETVHMGGFLSKYQIIGRNAFDLIAPKDRAMVTKDLKDRLEGHPKERMEYSIQPADGRAFEAELTASTLRDEEGNATGYIAVLRDITERKEAEEKLRESEKKYKELVEKEKDVIFSVDALGFINSINPAVSAWGYKTEELIGKNFIELIPEEWREKTAVELHNRLLQAGEITAETMVISKDGNVLPIEYSAIVIQDEGKYAGVRGIIRDISERKKTEDALRESEKKYKELVEQEKDAIFAIDANGIFTSINSAVTSWGYMPEEIVGKHYSMFLPPDLFEKLVAELSDPLRDAGEIVAEAIGIDKEGNRRPIEFSAILITKDHKFDGVRGIVRDIAERKRAEEALKQRNRELATLNKIAEAVSHPLGLNKVLRTALDSVLETMSFTGGSIWLVDSESSELRLVASKGARDMLTAGAAISKTIETGEATSTAYGGKTRAGRSKKAPAQNDDEGKSIVSVPLKSKGETLGVLGVIGDMSAFSLDDMRLLETVGDQIAVAVENAQLLDRLNELSITDELTGLFNRRHFYKVLESEMNRTRRYGRCISLAMIDLDWFKKYNDKFGHASGDIVLADFAKALKEGLRRTDTAFRYGGDEFIVILPATNAERAKEVIERISKKWLKRLAAKLPLADIMLGFSAGIAQFPENAETVDGLVFLSDTALYYAKRGGGQRVMLISDLGTSSLDVLSASTLDQVYALAATVDTKDPYTYGHSKRVAAIAESLGKAIGLSSNDLSDLTAAAFLHDIGKVGIADIILTKPGKPKKSEWAAIKKHCAEGAKIVQHVKELAPLAPVILHHHEWYDGTGYPDGLKGEEIPLHARIISVADAYDTMTTQRPYHEGVSPQKALEELERCSGTQFDPQLIEALRRITGNGSQADR